MKAIERARRSQASDQFSTDTPFTVHRPAHQQKGGWRPEIRQCVEDDPERTAWIDQRLAALMEKEGH